MDVKTNTFKIPKYPLYITVTLIVILVFLYALSRNFTQNNVFCYISKIYFITCSDQKGEKVTSYNAPQIEGKPGTHLISSPDGTKYIMIRTDEMKDSFFILNNTLNAERALDMNIGRIYGTSWSHNGKAIFLGHGNETATHIYKYIPNTQEVIKLTKNDSILNTNPYETKDGRIVYLTYEKKSPLGQLNIMNMDGTDTKPYTKIADSVANYDGILSYSYDKPSDTIFALVWTKTEPTVVLAYLPVNGSVKTVKVDQLRSSGDTITKLNNNSIVLSNPEQAEAKIIDLSTGTVTKTLNDFSSPIGFISASNIPFHPVGKLIPHNWQKR